MEAEAAQATSEAKARPDASRADGDGDAGQQARAESGVRERAESGALERPESSLRRTTESVAPEPREAEAAREWTPPKREFSAFVQSLESGEPRAGTEKLDVAVPPTGSASEVSGSLAPGQTGVDAGDASPVTGGESPATRAASPTAAAPRVTGEVPGVAAAGADSAEDVRARVARAREGTTRARVGKMREEALGVLEETPDDSGLRFVVAAAALFLVFLFLLFLSTTVLR
jgi:hypothetical protein